MNDFDFDRNIFWVDPNFNYNKNNFLFKGNSPEEIRSFATHRLTKIIRKNNEKISKEDPNKNDLIIQNLQIMEDLSYISENSSVENIYYYKYLIPFSVIPLKNYSFVKMNKGLLWFDFSEFDFNYGKTFVETYLPHLLSINFINSPSNEDAFGLKAFENNNPFIESFFLNSVIDDYSILNNKDLHSKTFSQVLDIIYQELYLKFEENVNSKAVTSSQKFYNKLKSFRKKLTEGELIVAEIIEFNQNLIKKSKNSIKYHVVKSVDTHDDESLILG